MNKQTKPSAVKQALFFVRHGVWALRPERLPWASRLGVYALRMIAFVGNGFRRNQCALHAASLTFFSLMALVPVLVLALALARTFGGANLAKAQVDAQITAWMSQMEQAVAARTGTDPTAAQDAVSKGAQADVTRAFSAQVQEIVDKLYKQVNTISFGTLGGIGLVMLLWTVIGVLGKVESSFNQVWGVEHPRSFVRKFSDYLSVILILPFLITAVSSVPVAGMITDAMDKTVGGPASESVRTLLHSGLLKTGLTLVLGALTFAFLLGFMPNERVRTPSALAGGFVTMVLFWVWLKLCAMLQIGIAKYSALYGGFAVLPILLMWVYTSWQIILLGSVVAFAVQERDTYMRDQAAANASPRARLLLALALCAEAARLAEDRNGGPFSADVFAQRHGVPHRFLREVLDGLIRNGFFAEVTDRPDTYLLCRSGERIAVADIVAAFLDDGETPAALGLDSLDASIVALGEKLNAAFRSALAMPMAKV